MAAKYTAVVFFHGVGDPQRHVSLSSFLDHFDLYGQSQKDGPLGSAQNFKYRSQALDDRSVLNYVELLNIRKSPKGTFFVKKHVRLYEAYWVPESGARYSTIYLLFWLLSRFLNPLKLLMSSWRNYSGLRLWTLICLSASGKAPVGRCRDLEKAYSDFDGWDNRREYPSGRFQDFRKFLSERYPSNPKKDQMLSLLSLWKKTFVSYNVKLIVKGLYYSILSFAFIFLFIDAAYILYNAWETGFGVKSQLYPTATLILTGVAIFLGWRALKHHAIDVLTWTLDAEKDERIKARRRVVGFGRRLIRQVIDDPDCEDCVLVGHSLGSCIAIESLLEEGKFVKAQGTDAGRTETNDSILKIRDVFTVGSPIDRIYYFFESDRTFSHRYNRMHEEQRLTINLPPYWDLSQAGTSRITNLWSRFDPISSEVNSVRKKVAERDNAIYNIECLPNGMPWPIGTHVSYFSDPAAIGRIYKSVMSGDMPSATQAKLPKMAASLTSAYLYLLPIGLAACLSFLLYGKIWLFWSGVAATLALIVAGGALRKRLTSHHKLHSGEYLER